MKSVAELAERWWEHRWTWASAIRRHGLGSPEAEAARLAFVAIDEERLRS